MDDIARAEGITQETRASHVRFAAGSYQGQYEGVFDRLQPDTLTDMIADLLHLADVSGFDPMAIVGSATLHFVHESADEKFGGGEDDAFGPELRVGGTD